MLTLTLRHKAGRQLGELHENMNRAYRKLRQGRRWQLAEARYGIAGSIGAREHTVGGNGWHPHLHVLLFVEHDLYDKLADMEQWIAQRWASVLGKLGESADLEHGTDIRPADKKAGEYIAKITASWGAAGELAGASSKMARRGNRTPAQLLGDFGRGDQAAGELYREYVAATYDTRWLFWSPGLRDLLGMGAEATDDEVAAEAEPGGVVLAVLTHEQWAWVRARQLRGQLIAEACAGDSGRLWLWLYCKGLELDKWQLDYTIESSAPWRE
jgi:hypothetical protein